MKITHEHLAHARRMVTSRETPLAGTGGAAPAFDAYLRAVGRIEMPGEMGEYARTRWAVIEKEGDRVTVHVEHWEEGIEFAEDDLADLAFDLLALRDIAATSRAGEER